MVQSASTDDSKNTFYAIMVCIDPEEDDWLFVTEDTPDSLLPKVKTFTDIHKALSYADAWVVPGKESNVQVVSYEN